MDSVQVRRQVGKWTAKVTLLREVTRHRDRTIVEDVRFHLTDRPCPERAAEHLRVASRVLADAADEVERMRGARIESLAARTSDTEGEDGS